MTARKGPDNPPLSLIPWAQHYTSCLGKAPARMQNALFPGRYRIFGALRGANRGHSLVSLLLIFFFAALVATIYFFHEEIRIPNLTPHSITQPGEKVDCVLFSSVGNKNLRILFSIPSKDKRQREVLLKEVPRIRHELLISMDDPDLMSSVENRDFDSIRSHFVRVINNHLDQPIDTIYFEGFYYD